MMSERSFGSNSSDHGTIPLKHYMLQNARFVLFMPPQWGSLG
jgi:hypothetical protein